MIDHRAPSALRQPPLCRRLLTGAVRAALAIQLAALATLAPTGARAQTWTGAASSAFGNAANWSTNAVPDSTHEANFVGGTPSAVSLANSQVSVAGLNFAANAPAFTLTLSSTGPIGQTLAIGAAGIVNLSPATQHIVAANANTAISLSGTNATISGTVELDASATLAAINFAAGASAGSATIVTTSGAKTTFSGASAGHATISVNNNQSGLSFVNGADAGNATIAIGALATTAFNDTSGAANAHISNAGELLFAGSASAQSAVINSSGTILFANGASAAAASITNLGALQFQDASSAANARITNAAGAALAFDDQSGAARASIANAGTLTFAGQSDLQEATITNQAGGQIVVRDHAQGAAATVVQSAGAVLDVSQATAAVSIGSLSGAGQVTLGGATLVLGALGANDIFSGTVSGTNGTLVKTGAGQLVLSGLAAIGALAQVAEGVLRVDGTLQCAVTVESGALLAGSGVVSGVLTAERGATVASGGAATLTVAGNALLAGGSWLSEAPRGAGSASAFQVSGTATIGGSLLALYAPGGAGRYAPGERFVVLTASQGVVGEFQSFASNLAYFDPTLVYAADSVTLVLRQPLIVLGPGTLTPNQQATAPVVIGLPALGAGLTGLSPASVRNLLDGLSGDEYSDVRRTNLELASGFTREVAERAAASAGDGAARSWIDWKGETESAAADSNAAAFRYQTRGLIGGGDLVQGDAVRMGWAGDIAHTNLGFAAASASGVADRWDVGFDASVTNGASLALATVSLGQDRDRLGSDAEAGRLDATLALVHQAGSEAPLVVENFLIDPRARFTVSGPHAATTWARLSLDLARPVTRTLSVHARLFGEASQRVREEEFYLGANLAW